MTQQKSAASPAPQHVAGFADRLAHWGRVALFLLTAGFMYPNIMSEGVDIAKIDADNEAAAKKQ